MGINFLLVFIIYSFMEMLFCGFILMIIELMLYIIFVLDVDLWVRGVGGRCYKNYEDWVIKNDI